MNNYTIQKLLYEDIDEILSIQNNLNISIISKTSLVYDINDEHYLYFTLKTNDPSTKIIGFVGISKVIDSIDLLSIVISKHFQNLGYGNILLNYIIEFAKENNVKNILLEVRESNLSAQRLYVKNGFKKINERKNYYTDNNENAFIYILKTD